MKPSVCKNSGKCVETEKGFSCNCTGKKYLNKYIAQQGNKVFLQFNVFSNDFLSKINSILVLQPFSRRLDRAKMYRASIEVLARNTIMSNMLSSNLSIFFFDLLFENRISFQKTLFTAKLQWWQHFPHICYQVITEVPVENMVNADMTRYMTHITVHAISGGKVCICIG